MTCDLERQSPWGKEKGGGIKSQSEKGVKMGGFHYSHHNTFAFTSFLFFLFSVLVFFFLFFLVYLFLSSFFLLPCFLFSWGKNLKVVFLFFSGLGHWVKSNQFGGVGWGAKDLAGIKSLGTGSVGRSACGLFVSYIYIDLSFETSLLSLLVNALS